MTIGEKIKELRRKNDVTQEKLADYLGISYQSVSKWETGAAQPDVSLIIPLANFFGATPDELFDFDSQKRDAEIVEYWEKHSQLAREGHMRELLELDRTLSKKHPKNHSLTIQYASSLLGTFGLFCQGLFSGQRIFIVSTNGIV
jgi:transcriptional regulator with XRE-family HTH domain